MDPNPLACVSHYIIYLVPNIFKIAYCRAGEPTSVSKSTPAKGPEAVPALDFGETSSPSSPSTPKANRRAALLSESSTPAAIGAASANELGTPGPGEAVFANEPKAPSAKAALASESGAAGANGVEIPSKAGAPKANGKTVGCEEVIKTVFSAEEEAFLRSLGWEDCGDDSEGMSCHVIQACFLICCCAMEVLSIGELDSSAVAMLPNFLWRAKIRVTLRIAGGLTEEEIAAFQAQVMASTKRPRPASSSPAKGVLTAACVIPLKANGSAGFSASLPSGRLADNNNGLADPRLPRDYHSELEFSDSEEE